MSLQFLPGTPKLAVVAEGADGVVAFFVVEVLQLQLSITFFKYLATVEAVATHVNQQRNIFVFLRMPPHCKAALALRDGVLAFVFRAVCCKYKKEN